MGSGCSTVNSAVASDTSGPGFKSCQQQLLTIFTVDCLLKRQKLRKRGLDGPIKKDEKCCKMFMFSFFSSKVSSLERQRHLGTENRTKNTLKGTFR